MLREMLEQSQAGKPLWLPDLRDAFAEADGAPYYETDFARPAAIVLGSEGRGVSDLVRRNCDFTVSIPMYGKVNSLNVSTAASVLLCHAARIQRSGGAGKK